MNARRHLLLQPPVTGSRLASPAPRRPWCRAGIRGALLLGAAALNSAPVLTAQNRGYSEAADLLRAGIHEAVVTGDEAGLTDLVIQARRAIAAFPDDALFSHYLGYGLFRLSGMMLEYDGNLALRMLEESATVLEHSIEIDPIPESHALIASGLVMRMMGDVDSTTLGMQHDAAMERARGQGPENPRVRLLEGISVFHRPAISGGGPNAALEHFEAAIELFARDRPEPPLPAWGFAEAHAWLGQTHETLGNVEAARSAYERALELEPEYAWVRDDLLPGLGGRLRSPGMHGAQPRQPRGMDRSTVVRSGCWSPPNK